MDGDTLCSACMCSACVLRREVEMMDDDDLAAFTAPLLTQNDEIEAYKRHLDKQFRPEGGSAGARPGSQARGGHRHRAARGTAAAGR